jgi:hypothetical protein
VENHRFFMALVAAPEGAELLCTAISETGTGTIIPPQVFAPVLEVNQMVSKNTYKITLSGLCF